MAAWLGSTTLPNLIRCFMSNMYISRSPSATYKIRSPHYNQAFFITISHDVVDGTRRIASIFINTKNMPSFQWVSALLESINVELSYENCDVPALAKRLRDTFDPSDGPYYVDGAKINGLVSHIGYVLESHLAELSEWR